MVLEKLKTFFQNRTNIILALVFVAILSGLGFAGYKFLNKSKPALPIEEVELPFDPEGPYSLLVPRNDGNALNLNVTRVGSYEEFSYELVYQSSISEVEHSTAEGGSGKVDRSAGNGDTFIKLKGQSEFKQEILFGTCSQGYTSGGAHCVFDKNVENGTLALRIKNKPETNAKVLKVYKTVTTWHLQKPDVALGVITSADEHFIYTSKAKREDLSLVGWSIVNDLSGSPKLPEGKKILGKVYAFNVPTAKEFPKGEIMIELADNPPQDAKLTRFIDSKNEWEMLETKINGSKLTASVNGIGIFAVLVNSK